MDVKKTVSRSGAAERLGVSRGRVTQLIDSGALETVKTADGVDLIPLAVIERRLAAKPEAGRPKKTA